MAGATCAFAIKPHRLSPPPISSKVFAAACTKMPCSALYVATIGRPARAIHGQTQYRCAQAPTSIHPSRASTRSHFARAQRSPCEGHRMHCSARIRPPPSFPPLGRAGGIRKPAPAQPRRRRPVSPAAASGSRWAHSSASRARTPPPRARPGRNLPADSRRPAGLLHGGSSAASKEL